MATKTKKTPKSAIFKLRQNLTIDTISQLYKEFLDCLEKNESIVIQSDSIENIDLTGIQFLMYSKNLAATASQNVQFDINFSDSTRLLISKTGFGRLLE
jgi:hypothetical protein